MPRIIYYFREFRCPDGHITHKLVENGTEFVMCEYNGCTYAAIKPEIYHQASVAIHGDEIDYIDHNLGKEPIHIRSKAERRRIMAERGLEEFIRHTPVPGTDRSPYTTDWSKGSMDPQTLENARVLVCRQGGVHVEEEEIASVANAFVMVAEPEMVHALVPAMSPEIREIYEREKAEYDAEPEPFNWDEDDDSSII